MSDAQEPSGIDVSGYTEGERTIEGARDRFRKITQAALERFWAATEDPFDPQTHARHLHEEVSLAASEYRGVINRLNHPIRLRHSR